MIDRLTKIIALITTPAAYFIVAYFVVAIVAKRGVQNAYSAATVAAVGPGLALLWAVAYMGIWITVSRRNPRKFTRSFMLLAVLPGVLGCLVAMGALFQP